MGDHRLTPNFGAIGTTTTINAGAAYGTLPDGEMRAGRIGNLLAFSRFPADHPSTLVR